MIIFDIETGPLDEEELLSQFHFAEPSPPGEFDESAVKLGNLKDEVKRKQKIEEARAAHKAAVENHDVAVTAARDAAWEEFYSRAALSPLTGRILVIGYHSTDRGTTVLDAGEKGGDGEVEILTNFWRRYALCRQEKRRLVGHNCSGFDVPFICRRSWLLGVDVPNSVFERGRYLDSLVFADTMQLWACGGRDYVKLGTLAQAFGGNGKPTDENGEALDGSMFASLWMTDRPRAEEYLRNDLAMTARVAERMGLM